MPATTEEAQTAFELIKNREHYFSTQAPWSQLQSQLETTVRREGFLGLTKSFCFLKVLEKRQIVLSTEPARLLETISKQLHRELADALGLTPREIEAQIAKAIRPKLLADQ